MGGVCVRLGEANMDLWTIIVQSLALQTFGIAYEGFIIGQTILAPSNLETKLRPCRQLMSITDIIN